MPALPAGLPSSSLPGLLGHVAVVDLSYGDAGKGTTVELLASRGARAVVRFNGGAQAAHNVVLPSGAHHTFSQFTSATLSGVETFLSRYVVVEPYSLMREAEHLVSLGVLDPLLLLWVDPLALVTTPYHRLANQRREVLRGGGAHGSCGVGFGETVAHSLAYPQDAIRVCDMASQSSLRRRLRAVRDALEAELGPLHGPDPDDLATLFRDVFARVQVARDDRLGRLLGEGPCVFEGSQGVLLDEWQGFHPHTTWSTTTFENADQLASEGGVELYHLGVLRTYTTRHGLGPCVSEDPGLRPVLPEAHNVRGRWQGDFRVGHLDVVAHRYAIEVAGRVDGLSLTHLDRVDPSMRVCVAYDTPAGTVSRLALCPRGDLVPQEALTRSLLASSPVLVSREGTWVETVTGMLDVPVVVTSSGPTVLDKVVLQGVLV